MKVRVTNIQRFSLQDGPGIRTTIFLKGCQLNCPWCSNPENINYDIEKYYDFDEFKDNIFGYDIDLEELNKEILKDEKYYRVGNGGVTFSGGEALLQFDKLEPLLKKLKQENINICIETSLFAPTKNLDIAIKYVDEFYVDIKILDKKLCSNVLNGNLELYYKNLDFLFNNVNKVKVIFRIPIVNEYTFDDKNISNIICILKKYKPKKVEIFRIHNLAEKKYMVLNRDIYKTSPVDDSKIKYLINIIEKLNLPIEEIKL